MRGEKHIELVEAVNNATTEIEHSIADAKLHGFRLGLRHAGAKLNLADCDMFYIDQGIDRPMCCGVFLDWEPSKRVTP